MKESNDYFLVVITLDVQRSAGELLPIKVVGRLVRDVRDRWRTIRQSLLRSLDGSYKTRYALNRGKSQKDWTGYLSHYQFAVERLPFDVPWWVLRQPSLWIFYFYVHLPSPSLFLRFGGGFRTSSGELLVEVSGRLLCHVGFPVLHSTKRSDSGRKLNVIGYLYEIFWVFFHIR